MARAQRELEDRTAFVKSCKDRVAAMQRTMAEREAEARRKEREAVTAAVGGGAASAGDVQLNVRPEPRNQREHFQQQQQSVAQLKQEQGEHLSALSTSVAALNQGANTIYDELKEQEAELELLDQDINKASEKMDFVTEKIGKLLKTKSRCGICTVIILSIIVIILIIVVSVIK